MARYIDAVKTADIISEKLNIPFGDLVDVFADVPTADVEEVRHGEWIQSEYDRNTFVCSECGKYIQTATEPRMYYPYCHCGAKMDVRYAE